VITGIRTPDGDTIRVDREGGVEDRDYRDGSQSQETVERGAIGAALGALIGAVAGGGKGAVIGAAIGAGVGAGTAIVEGRDRLDLQSGTELAITSGTPWNRQGFPIVQR
jgi:outer membrane lipoprotein SlyB